MTIHSPHASSSVKDIWERMLSTEAVTSSSWISAPLTVAATPPTPFDPDVELPEHAVMLTTHKADRLTAQTALAIVEAFMKPFPLHENVRQRRRKAAHETSIPHEM